MKISLLHVTARPWAHGLAASQWKFAAVDALSVEHVITYDQDFFAERPRSLFRNWAVDVNSGKTPVTGWNLAAEISIGDVLVMVSDDVFLPPYWDVLIENEIGDPSKEIALWVSQYCDTESGREVLHPGLMCFPICTRAYWKRYGYFLHPAYFCRFSDFEFTLVAQRDGVVIDARERIAFKHQDHHAPEYVMEETSRRINDLHPVDEQIFHARQAAGFPKEWPAFKFVEV